MADTPKSKLPNLDEISGIAGKLFKDVKKSITEIVADYKEKRAEAAQATPATETKTEVTPPEQKAEKTEEPSDKESQ